MAGGPVHADRTCIFLGEKLMFVSVMNFDQIKKIRFVVVKIFWSCSNQFSVILIWSSELASLKLVFDKIRFLIRLCYKVVLKIMEKLSLKKLLSLLVLVTEITSNLGMNCFFK